MGCITSPINLRTGWEDAVDRSGSSAELRALSGPLRDVHYPAERYVMLPRNCGA